MEGKDPSGNWWIEGKDSSGSYGGWKLRILVETMENGRKGSQWKLWLMEGKESSGNYGGWKVRIPVETMVDGR